MTEPLTQFLELAKTLGASGSLDKTLTAVVECAVGLMGVPRISIRLLDPEHRALIAICRAGQPLHYNPTVTYDLGEGLLGWIAKNGKPLRSADPMSDPRFVKRPDMIDPMGSFLGVPIIASGAVIGVLSAVAKTKDAFTPGHETLLVRISDIAAPYVEVARRRRIEQVSRGG